MKRHMHSDETQPVRSHAGKDIQMLGTTTRDQRRRLNVFRAFSLMALALMLAGSLGFVTALGADAATIRRSVAITASMSITDDEFFRDEHCSANKTGRFTLTSTRPLGTFHMTKGCGGEVRVELHVNRVQLRNNGSLYVTGEVRLYEGVTERTTDLEDRKTFAFYVTTNRSYTKTIRLYNSESFGGDSATVQFTIVNRAA
jgi:hypothetical protein